jgi:hypothetical protein
MTQTIKSVKDVKSVHIKEFWPYQYVKPDRRVFKRETMDRANARKREIYHQKKKLIGLQVFEMDIDICHRLNNATTKNSK